MAGTPQLPGFYSGAPAGIGSPGGSYSLEAMWTNRSTTLLLHPNSCQTRGCAWQSIRWAQCQPQHQRWKREHGGSKHGVCGGHEFLHNVRSLCMTLCCFSIAGGAWFCYWAACNIDISSRHDIKVTEAGPLYVICKLSNIHKKYLNLSHTLHFSLL